MSSGRVAASTMETIERPCPCCGGDGFVPLGRARAEPPAPPGPWTYVRCRGCASGYLRPRPADPLELYSASYHVHQRAGLAARVTAGLAALEARRLARYLPLGGRVHEIGCGPGDLLGQLARRGYQVSGIEPSASAVAAARAAGLDVEVGSYRDRIGDAGTQDLVIASHVLEHVEDPGVFLAEVVRLLRSGGVGFLKVPVADAWDQSVFGLHSGSFDVPYHLFVPSRRALLGMTTAAGLKLDALRFDPVPNDWIHGLRKLLRARTGLRLSWMRPWNPLLAGLFLPCSALAALARRSGRLRLVVRKP